MAMNPVDCILQELMKRADIEQARNIARYLKMPVHSVFGVKLPFIHKAVDKCTKEVDTNGLIQIMQELWKLGKHETRVAAIDVMKKYAKEGDVKTALKIASEWIEEVDTWAHMDPLGSNCIGTLLLRDSGIENILQDWASAENFWRRRASILPYLHLSKKTVYKGEFAERILGAIKPHIDDEEFFVGKAAAWVLREFSKREPERAGEFIRENRNKMTSLVLREGSRKLEDI
ncbi:DNA alkylation repair protein [Candidatus Thorarchaeota archaeon]|nr:MAG: DNA alkylation repair protein [Candidatus Thorarchaeota archaeon]